MVAKKGTKRQAVAAAPAPKKAKVDPALEGVLEAIAQAENLPETCRKMLQASVPLGLGTPRDERHELQTSMVAMIGEVVAGVQSKLQEALEAESSKLVEVEGRRAELQAAVTSAEEVVATASKEAEEKAEALKEATERTGSAKMSLTEKQEIQSSGDAAMVEAKENKAALEKGIEESLRIIVEGVAEDMVQRYEALLPLLQNVSLDESLMSALPSVCSKKAEARGAFDTMVLEQFSQVLQDRVAALAKTIDESLPASQEREAAVQEAQGKVDECSAAEAAAVEATSTANSARQVAEDGLKSATDAFAAFEPEYSKATQQRDQEAQKLDDFKLHSVSSFETLRDKATVVDVTVGGA